MDTAGLQAAPGAAWMATEVCVYLSRDDILKAEDVEQETVFVPKWGGEVLVRGMTGRQRDRFEATMIERRGKRSAVNTANARAKLVAQCVVDEDGNRLLSDADAEILGEKSAASLTRVYEVAARLSGLTDEDIEELIEDFGGTPGGDSSSASPGNSGSQPENSSTP